MLLSEIKAEYLDPKLVSRTQDQVNAKKEIINFYESKVLSASEQIWALQNAKKYKIEQLKNKLLQMDNKIQGEQADVVALTNECDLLKDQYERQQKMFDDGLSLRGVGYFFWEFELTVSYSTVSVVDCVSLEGWFSNYKGIQDDSDGPDIDFVGMAGLV